jgi:acyl-CoA thioester hydrolase
MDAGYLEKKIYYHDTDCGGVVYYANYLKYLEEARTEFLSLRGIDLKSLSERGIFFVVARVEIDYKSPARYQDTIRIFTGIEKVRPVALQFSQEILKDNAPVAESKTTLVCIGRDFKPMPLPEEIRKVL